MIRAFVTQSTLEWDTESSYVLFANNTSEARLKAVEILGMDPKNFTIEEYAIYDHLILKANGYDHVYIEKVELDLENDKEVA